MPYEPHAALLQPEDENAYIWRFIDLPKFIDLLHTGSLYFTRADKFDDPYEGLMPDEYVESIRHGLSNLGSVHRQIRMFAHYRADFFVNCWHISPYESAGMWKLYAGVDAGIALRSTYSRLKSELMNSPERSFMGLTNYDASSVFGPVNGFKFMMYKRPSFEHEREVRALIWDPSQTTVFDIDSDEPISGPLPSRPGPSGRHLPVRLQELVFEVVLSPTSPPWLVETLAGAIKRFGYDIPVRMSPLNQLAYLTQET